MGACDAAVRPEVGRKGNRRVRVFLYEFVTGGGFLGRGWDWPPESLLSDFLEATGKRFGSGSAPYLDVIRAKVELARQLASAISSSLAISRMRISSRVTPSTPSRASP